VVAVGWFLPILPGIGGIAGLDNKSLYVPDKDASAVIIAGAQCEEILARLGTGIAEELNFKVTHVGVQRYGL